MAKIATPVFDDTVRLDQYETEVKAWCKVTSIEAEKRAIVLVLAMPDKKNDILESINSDDLSVAGGVDILLKHLKDNYGKDELLESLEIYEDFRKFERLSNQSIGEFCSGFESRRKRIENKGIKFPEEILAFELIRNANISKSERKLVLTGLNLAEKKGMYKDAIISLKKFLGEGYTESKCEIDCDNIKVEPAYAAWNRTLRGNFRGRNNELRGNRGQRYYRGYRGARGGVRTNESINPIGRDGSRLKCFRCNASNHLIFQCPLRYNNVNLVDESNANALERKKEDKISETYFTEDHIIMYTGYNKHRVNELCLETTGCAILDSACASNVAGENWYLDYINNYLSIKQKNSIIIKKGIKQFRFGDGPIIKSIKQVELPVCVGGKELRLVVDIVNAHIPFLMSKNQMKELGMILDLSRDEVIFRNKKITLNESNSGHYILPLKENQDEIKVYTVKLDGMFGNEAKTVLTKLHNQFGHPVKKKLKGLLMDSNVWKDEFEHLLEEISNRCKICRLYKKTPDRPVVALSMANEFNEAVCMDLKKLSCNKWILHMIDMHTRYTRSVIIDRKESKGVLDKIMKEWIGIFGVPSKLLTDNGGEFTSQEMREVMSFLNVVKLTTGAEAPWQNGLCEKVHQVTDMIMLKLQASYPEAELEYILAWANMARNSMQMYQGYSSHQLVFGINPNLPNILQDKPPSMNENTSSDVFAKHLNLLRANREAFIKSDSCMKIRRALRSKIRCSQKHFNQGDWVYYKRNNSERWLGPAKVVFQDGKVVFVRHGSVFYRVSVNRINNVEEDEIEAYSPVNNDNSNSEVDYDNAEDPIIEERDQIPTKKENPEDLNEENENPLKELEELTNEILNEEKKEYHPCSVCKFNVEKDMKALECDICKLWCHIACGGVSEITYSMLMKKKIIKWKCPNHKRRRKSRSSNEKVIQKVYVNFIPKAKWNNKPCVAAKMEELEKLKSFNVYEEVNGDYKDCITTRWVMAMKGDKVKARIVVRGFEENFLLQKDSPTVTKCGINILLMIAASKHWIVKSIDIKSAFLQSNDLEREVLVKPPKEANVEHGKIWRLKKPLYGLDDASRQFYLSVKDTLIKSNCQQSAGDASFYYLRKEDLEGIILSHIDDFLHIGNMQFEKQVINNLTSNFVVGKQAEENFSYVGYQITQISGGITVDQIDYINSLEFTKLQCNEENKKRLLNEDELTNYRSIIGSLNWCVRGTRPDLSFDLIDLSTKLKNANVEDYNRALKAIRKLKGRNVKIFFPDLGKLDNDLEIIIYSDAAFHNLNDGIASTMAYIVFCKKGDKCCPIFWKTNKVQRVVLSSLGAETLALAKAISDTVYFKNFIQETLGINPKITAFVDNKGLAECAYSSNTIEDKRCLLDLAAIRDDLSKGVVENILWIAGSDMLVDCMTKLRPTPNALLNVLSEGKISLPSY